MVNNDNPKICVAGLGAIGGVIAARLAAAGHNVKVLARGQSLMTVREKGLRLTDLSGEQHIRLDTYDRVDFGIQDVIFLCAKSHDLPALLAQIHPSVGPDTIVIPTSNGLPWWYFHGEGGRFDGETVRSVDPEASLSRILPMHHILGCVVYITAEALAPGVILARNRHSLVLGEPTGQISERLSWVCALLKNSGIEARSTPTIRDTIWLKLLGNLVSNPVSVLTGGTLEEIYGDASLRDDVVGGMMREITLVAATYGIRVALDPNMFIELAKDMGAVRTSMLQDHANGRPLELGSIGDAVLELAARYAIPMPTTRAVLALSHALAARRTLAPKNLPSPEDL